MSVKRYSIVAFALFEGLYKKLIAYEPHKAGEVINGEYQVISCELMEVIDYGNE